MATLYVSNTASNGYGLGNDTTGNGSQATPYLTINKADSVAGAGDTITVNPTATAYVETSGSGFLNLSHAETLVQGDPTLLATAGKPTIKASTGATQRVVALGNAASITLANFIIDAQNTSNFAAITIGTQTYNVNNITFKNVTNGAVGPSNAAGRTCTVDKATMLLSDGNVSTSNLMQFSNTTGGGTSAFWTVTGATLNGVGYLCSFVGNTVAQGSMTIGNSGDGTQCTLTNCTGIIKLTSSAVLTYPLISIQNVSVPSFSGSVSTTGVIDLNGSSNHLITSLLIKNNTFVGGGNRCIDIGVATTAGEISGNTATIDATNGTSEFVTGGSTHMNGMVIHNNAATLTNVGAQAMDAFLLDLVGSGFQFYSNTFSTDASSAHIVDINGDGVVENSIYNIGTATGQQSLGAASGNVYLYSKILTPTGNNNPLNVQGVNVFLRKVGTPVGNVTVKLYSNTAGAPGTLLATSNLTLTPAMVTASQFYCFPFTTPPLMTSATNYFVVFQYTGTPDGTNYFQIDYNANAGVTTPSVCANIVSIGTSADNVTWTADATKAFVNGIRLINSLCVSPLIYSNVLTCTNSNQVLNHGLIFNGCSGALVYKNIVVNAGIGIIGKLVDGSTNNALVYDNLVSSYRGTHQAENYRDKGSTSLKFYNNTSVVNNVPTYNYQVGSDFLSSGSIYNPCAGGQPSVNGVFENNILYRNAASTLNYLYFLDNANGFGAYAYGSVTGLTINFNDAYAGSNTDFALDDRASLGTVVVTSGAWQALGFDANSVFTNPRLANTTNATVAADFVPSLTSPAKAIGIPNTAVTTDYLGNPFFLIPDAGAYSISYYAQQASLGFVYKYNVFTSNFDIVGIGSATAALFAPAPQITTVTSSIAIPSIANQNVVILADATGGNIVVTVPIVAGGMYSVKKIDSSSNTVTIIPASGTIDGAGSKVISIQYGAIDCAGNGTNLYILPKISANTDILGILPVANGGTGTATPSYIANYVHTIFTPTTGQTITLVKNQYNIVNPAGALLALTINLPSTPSNNDVVYIKFTQNITTVTYANGTVVDGITAPTAGGLTVLTYDSGTTSWY